MKVLRYDPGPDLLLVRALVDDAAAVDGVAAIGGHVLDALGVEPAAVSLRVITDQDRVVGLAAGREREPGEVVVAPAYRRRGYGTALVSAELDAVGAVWAHGDLPAARALAQRLSLVRTRELLRMSCSCAEPWPEPVWPADATLRTFVPGVDEREFLGVNARAFAWHPEQGRLDLAGLQAEMRQDWFDPAGFFLAVDSSGRILGFHWTKVHPGGIGEIYVLGVDPDSGRRGLGRPLALTGLNYLAARGLSQFLLYVEGDNVAALKLYDALGFTVAATDAVYRHG